jgi:hypothetical protein
LLIEHGGSSITERAFDQYGSISAWDFLTSYYTVHDPVTTTSLLRVMMLHGDPPVSHMDHLALGQAQVIED